MIHVSLFGDLRRFTNGVGELLDAEAGNVRQLFAVLGQLFPELRPHLCAGIAVAIDGQIYQDALMQPIPDGSEVHLLPHVAGG